MNLRRVASKVASRYLAAVSGSMTKSLTILEDGDGPFAACVGFDPSPELLESREWETDKQWKLVQDDGDPNGTVYLMHAEAENGEPNGCAISGEDVEDALAKGWVPLMSDLDVFRSEEELLEMYPAEED